MKIKCDTCGNEINWWETTEAGGRLSACPACDELEKGQVQQNEKK